MGGGGGMKTILTKSEGLHPSEVRGRILAVEGNNKPIKGNGGAVFLLARGSEWRNLTMGMTILKVAGTERYIQR